MIAFFRKLAVFIIYVFLLLNVFIATTANVFSENIQENNERYASAMFLLIIFYFRKSILKLPITLFKRITKMQY